MRTKKSRICDEMATCLPKGNRRTAILLLPLSAGVAVCPRRLRVLAWRSTHEHSAHFAVLYAQNNVICVFFS
jgi:hypothetical protein